MTALEKTPTALSRLTVALVLWSLSIGFAFPQQPQSDAEYVRSNYTKFEYRIPARDGVRLFTAVYIPNDRTQTYPILLFRTPYSVGPYGADQYKETLGPNKRFDREGFIFAFQDVRGRYMSEGTFVDMTPHVAEKKSKQDVDESTDT